MSDRSERAIRGGRLELKKAGEAGEGFYSGYGALFGVLCPTSSWQLPADWSDRFRLGAFSEALATRQKNGGLFPACWQHDLDTPVGSYPVIREDETGLYCEGQLATKTTKGAETYELMKIQAVSGLSVQYIPRKIELDEETKIRDIVVAELIEIAPVTVPNMDGARITDVKSARPSDLKRQLEAALRDAGLSRSEAKAVLADGFNALGLRDAVPDGLPDEAVAEALRRLTSTIQGVTHE